MKRTPLVVEEPWADIERALYDDLKGEMRVDPEILEDAPARSSEVTFDDRVRAPKRLNLGSVENQHRDEHGEVSVHMGFVGRVDVGRALS